MKTKKLFANKKGQLFGGLQALTVGILSVSLVLVFTFLIIAQGKTQINSIEGVNCNNHSTAAGGGGTSLACNATTTLEGAVADIPGWVPLIVLAVIATVLLGLVGLFSKRY